VAAAGPPLLRRSPTIDFLCATHIGNLPPTERIRELCISTTTTLLLLSSTNQSTYSTHGKQQKSAAPAKTTTAPRTALIGSLFKSIF